jgi:hypothetical protein
MLRDYLTLTGSVVTITRSVVTPDGMGGATTTSTITGLPRAVIWSPGQSERYISDKMARASTHILVTEPADYSFTVQDVYVSYNSKTYRITGPSDNVMNLGEIMVTGMELIE